MKKEDILDWSKRIEAEQRRAGRRIIVGLVLVTFALFGVVGLDEYHHFLRNPWIKFPILFGFVGVMLVAILLPARPYNRCVKNTAIKCPNCDASLHGTLAQVAIASDRCGVCGAVVFDDTAEQPAPQVQ